MNCEYEVHVIVLIRTLTHGRKQLPAAAVTVLYMYKLPTCAWTL